MKTKILLLAVLCFTSCGNQQKKVETKDDLALKKIKQKIEIAGMGLIKEFEVDSLVKINDTTYFSRHFFYNEMVDKEMRISRNYYFNDGYDSVVEIDDILIEMRSQGEWVPTGW